MNNYNANIYTSSVLKVTNRLEVYGKGDLTDINLLKMLYKYSCYSLDEETRRRLDTMVSELQMKDNDICMDFSNGTFYLQDEGNDVIAPPSEVTNTAPTVDDNAFAIGTGEKILIHLKLRTSH